MRDKLPQATAGTFYQRLNQTLDEIGFAQGVRGACQLAYQDPSAGGRPRIDLAIYFKMLMVGPFESLPNERAIASRCADSFSLRAFLSCDLSKSTPDHSTLSVIRTRRGIDVYQSALELVLQALHGHGLFMGCKLEIASTIEANVSLREFVKRNTDEAYVGVEEVCGLQTQLGG